jgi:molybdate transport system substrate-binding protein
MKTPWWIAAAVVALGSSAVDAADIKVLSTRATEEIYRELVPQFEQASGHKVTTTFVGTSDLQKRIAAGEAYDVVILIDTAIDDFIKSGKVLAGSRVDITKSGIGIGVRSGLPKPDVASPAALKKALLAAKSIGYTTGPSGEAIDRMLRKMGIADAVKSRVKLPPSGTLVGTIIADGEADIGFQQTNELSHFPGVDYLGPLPAEFQDVTLRSGGILVASKEKAAAQQLLKFLSGPEAAPVIRQHGLDPA